MISGADNRTATHHRSARGTAARADDRGTAHRASAPRRDFDEGTVLLELMLEQLFAWGTSADAGFAMMAVQESTGLPQ